MEAAAQFLQAKFVQGVYPYLLAHKCINYGKVRHLCRYYAVVTTGDMLRSLF